MSATRTQARMDNLAVGLVAAGSPLRLPFEGKARMAPYGCSAVNWPEMSSTRAGRPRQSRERQIKEAVSLVAPLDFMTTRAFSNCARRPSDPDISISLGAHGGRRSAASVTSSLMVSLDHLVGASE